MMQYSLKYVYNCKGEKITLLLHEIYDVFNFDSNPGQGLLLILKTRRMF